ncbi:MAG: transglycosylase SLT domain-containing protein [Myxococcota bacterium]
MTSGGSSGGDFLGQGRGRFLLDLEVCLTHWRRAIASGARPGTPEAGVLRHASHDLSSRARGVGFGGIGHHLGSLLSQFEAGAPQAALNETLETVTHLAGQARYELAPAELASMQRAASGEAPRGPGGSDPAPPPMMTMAGQRGSGAPRAAASGVMRSGPESIRPPRLLDSGIISHGNSAPPPGVQPLAPLGGPAAPLPALSQPNFQPGAPLPALGQPNVHGGALPAMGQPPLPAPPTVLPNHPNAPPPLQSASMPAPVAPPQAVFEVAPPPASRPGGAPNLLVRSMLGLRAFGKGGAKTNSPPPPPPDAPPQAPPGGGLLGLGSGRREATSGISRPPPRLDRLPSGLPPLAPPSGDAGPSNKSGPVPLARSNSQSGRMQQLLGDISQGRETPHKGLRRGRRNLRDRHEGGSWATGVLIGLGVLIVLGGLATIVVILTRRPGTTTATSTPTASASVVASGSNVPKLPNITLTTENEQLGILLQQVHGRGKESPELRKLMDENAALAAKALAKKCTGAASCAEQEAIKKSLLGTGPKRAIKRRKDTNTADKLRSSWLVGLKMPEIPVEDDPRVARQFQFYTENTVGRETFQAMLFRCGAYRDMIQSTLVRYGLPADLWAVVFAESSCEPRAQSPVGAAGLWQFIPSAARAYHLRVIENVVDERLSPPKATEAGVRYMRDMYEKLGQWDLVFASYNLGPFALMARIEQAGGDVGFWDLVDAEMLPDETANYAPAIQAIALILNNVQRLKFSTQMRPPQLTSDLVVPPNTRLSLVARAAATSVAHLHALNLDIAGEATPNVADFAIQVPKDAVWQARDTLKDLLARRDDDDLCVPASFDWGRQRFTQEMAEACRRRSPSGAPSAAAP